MPMCSGETVKQAGKQGQSRSSSVAKCFAGASEATHTPLPMIVWSASARSPYEREKGALTTASIASRLLPGLCAAGDVLACMCAPCVWLAALWR